MIGCRVRISTASKSHEGRITKTRGPRSGGNLHMVGCTLIDFHAHEHVQTLITDTSTFLACDDRICCQMMIHISSSNDGMLGSSQVRRELSHKSHIRWQAPEPSYPSSTPPLPGRVDHLDLLPSDSQLWWAQNLVDICGNTCRYVLHKKRKTCKTTLSSRCSCRVDTCIYCCACYIEDIDRMLG